MCAGVSQLDTFDGNGTVARVRMGDIRIPEALAKMDGVFGYKVVSSKNADRSDHYAFEENTIIDWIFNFLYKLEQYPPTRSKTIEAFKQIAKQIEGSDNGEFKALVGKYASNGEAIDYSRIRDVLRASLAYHPPRVYSRPAFIGNSSEASNVAPAIDFKKMYLQNIRKSVCNEEFEVTIFREGPFAVVTDENLEALAAAIFLHFRRGGQEITIVEPDFHIATRMKLMQYETLKQLGAIFVMDQDLRMEILKFRLELIRKNPAMSVKEIKLRTQNDFRVSKAYVKDQLEKLSKPDQ